MCVYVKCNKPKTSFCKSDLVAEFDVQLWHGSTADAESGSARKCVVTM